MKPRDAAHQRYLDSEPNQLGAAETEIPPQTVYFKNYDLDAADSLEGLTEEHIWLRGVSIPRILITMIRQLNHRNEKLHMRLSKVEQQLAELKR